ncbi:MAG: RHS repeat-associated core domain-containing protein [Terriglobales bacterium]
MEYDALGRLTSVCEITSGSGSGSCGQTQAQQTGYWTKYTYDVLNNLTSVTQNAQASPANQQTRSYAYDGLGRLTSETNPESGATTYTYDSATLSCGAGSVYPGDLVRKVDANGTSTCYFYDSLHRVTDVGTNRSSTDGCKRYRYDNSTGVLGSRPTGVAPANSLGRLVEAATDTCAWPVTQQSILTDEWFSYSARGETTDVWQSSPQSGGYYHATASYWANGALNTLSGLGLPTFTYGVDAQGRPFAVTASSGTSPIPASPGLTYNTSGQVTGVTFGSADSDTFTYDASTGRMTQYKYTVGATPQNVTGDLTWNTNGTLRTLAITDPFNSSNQQTCTYTYDDLARVSGANCGSIWTQTFGYDPFGNITKAGNLAFQASYDTTKNRVTTAGGVSFAYDSNGNTTADNAHTYTWDSEGKTLSVDGSAVSLTYDALGRMVEQNRSGAHKQIVYGPGGQKLALMNGPTVSKAFIALPGGGVAVYAGTTLSYFRHPDWLGSSRFASNVNRTVYSDTAYAPFGEPYAETGTTDRSFTGQNQDTISDNATGLYDFLYREYALYGRWTTPDPAGMAAVYPANPQSWNRYAYVLNNPMAAIDPDGRDWCYIDGCSGGRNPHGGGGGGFAGRIAAMENAGMDFGSSDWGNDLLATPSWVAPTILEGIARHESIISTGWDPALGSWRGSIDIVAPNGDKTTINNVPDADLQTIAGGIRASLEASQQHSTIATLSAMGGVFFFLPPGGLPGGSNAQWIAEAAEQARQAAAVARASMFQGAQTALRYAAAEGPAFVLIATDTLSKVAQLAGNALANVPNAARNFHPGPVLLMIYNPNQPVQQMQTQLPCAAQGC